MKTIRWGILSTSNFALTKMVPALQKCSVAELTAIASRELSQAQSAASRMGIPKAYGSYESLLADPEIEVVYIPLPNHLHVSWSIKALEAGKHVLCEKPIGLSADDATRLLDVSRAHPKLKVMEGFMYRYHPQWEFAKRMVKDGRIGQLTTIQSFFCYYNVDERNIRNRADIGGGGLMDIGCYSISLSRFIFGREPNRVMGVMEYDPRFQTDIMTSGILDFGSGATSTFTCSTQLAPYQRVNILGTGGRIEIEIPFNAPPNRGCRLLHEEETQTEARDITFETCDQYTIQADRFSQAIIDGTPQPTPLEDAVNNMRVIDAVVESAREGRWVELPGLY